MRELTASNWMIFEDMMADGDTFLALDWTTHCEGRCDDATLLQTSHECPFIH